MTRPDWDTYFLDIAKVVASRADCSRRMVGAVVVRDHRIASTGYNGGPPGGASCLHGDCPRANTSAVPGSDYENTACIALHAEVNAIVYAGRDKTLGATLYITDEPCYMCQRVIEAAGIERVVTP